MPAEAEHERPAIACSTPSRRCSSPPAAAPPRSTPSPPRPRSPRAVCCTTSTARTRSSRACSTASQRGAEDAERMRTAPAGARRVLPADVGRHRQRLRPRPRRHRTHRPGERLPRVGGAGRPARRLVRRAARAPGRRGPGPHHPADRRRPLLRRHHRPGREERAQARPRRAAGASTCSEPIRPSSRISAVVSGMTTEAVGSRIEIARLTKRFGDLTPPRRLVGSHHDPNASTEP